jgi:hypothetical protein
VQAKTVKKEGEGNDEVSGHGVVNVSSEMEVDASSAQRGPMDTGSSSGRGSGEAAADGQGLGEDAQEPRTSRARIVMPGGAGDGENPVLAAGSVMIVQELAELPTFNGSRVLLLRLGARAGTWLVEVESTGENLEVPAAKLRRPLFNKPWKSASSIRTDAANG